MSDNTAATVTFLGWLAFVGFMCWCFSPWFILLAFILNVRLRFR